VLLELTGTGTALTADVYDCEARAAEIRCGTAVLADREPHAEVSRPVPDRRRRQGKCPARLPNYGERQHRCRTAPRQIGAVCVRRTVMEFEVALQCLDNSWVCRSDRRLDEPRAFIAQPCHCCFTWISGVDLKARIYGRPRSDRKRRFLLSVVDPSTGTKHPREARPINWAQRGGLASGGKCLLTPRPHFTAHHARLVTT
jgi:hypothetical protein